MKPLSLSIFSCKDVNECTPFETKNGALVASIIESKISDPN